jgi:hypothetical protein
MMITLRRSESVFYYSLGRLMAAVLDCFQDDRV